MVLDRVECNIGREKPYHKLDSLTIYDSFTLMSKGMVPCTVLDRIIHYDQPCYSGQFSDDGNFFFACAQDFKVRMYDTSNPYEWKHYKTVLHPLSSWTISDATLSPDNKYLAYSTLTSIVSLSGTDPSADSDPILLDFSAPEPRLRYSGRAVSVCGFY